MKKIVFLIVVILITTFCLYKGNGKEEDTRGVFISYLEYEEYFKGKNELEIEERIKEIVESLNDFKINTIYLQVRMFSDSIYKSNIFPFTDTIGKYQDDSINIDVLDTFIKYAKDNRIKIYAWINPYRISTNTDVTRIAKTNPAYIYLNTNHVSVIEGKGIYYNPASNVVKNIILSGIVELVSNYDIDGIMFDDYFYPDDKIDLENYEEVKNTVSITEYRLNQVNDLIHRTYLTIKSINPNVEFGISPDGNINNNYEIHYADVRKWLSEDGYIDFIIPQIYYGFNNEIVPFIKTVNEWDNLIKNDTKLIVGLALYKSGTIDMYAKSGKNEWVDSNNIIVSEIKESEKMKHYQGFSLFRYDNLINAKNVNLKEEVNNYVKFSKKY